MACGGVTGILFLKPGVEGWDQAGTNGRMSWCEVEWAGWGLAPEDRVVARQCGKLKGTCLKSHSQGGGSRG